MLKTDLYSAIKSEDSEVCRQFDIGVQHLAVSAESMLMAFTVARPRLSNKLLLSPLTWFSTYSLRVQPIAEDAPVYWWR